MILLQPIIEIFIRPMCHIISHHLADGTWIGSMTIRRHLIGHRANHSNRLLEKPFGCIRIPLLAQHGINQIAIVVDRPLQITSLPIHFQVGLINIPEFPCLPMSLAS